MSSKKIILLSFLAVSFFAGLFMRNSAVGSIATVLMIACPIIIIVLLSFENISKLSREKGPTKGILLGILFILVLIPLVFFGTCLLGFGGMAAGNVIRSLFGR